MTGDVLLESLLNPPGQCLLVVLDLLLDTLGHVRLDSRRAVLLRHHHHDLYSTINREKGDVHLHMVLGLVILVVVGIAYSTLVEGQECHRDEHLLVAVETGRDAFPVIREDFPGEGEDRRGYELDAILLTDDSHLSG